MPTMLKTLVGGLAKGAPGGRTWARCREVMSLQYRRSFKNLERFARNPSDPHLKAWKDFNRRIGPEGSLESGTFLVEAGRYERVYGNMLLFGLATKQVAAMGNRETLGCAWVDTASLRWRRYHNSHDLPAGYHLLAKQVR